ncbi:hypothetical protein QP162_20935 [Sphingomonas aurantiaca]|uniref:hypothetical protein n=1 Tax=Sphingomonas aurantiaca TaxID=185949 RepID=UPI002FE3C350
MSEIIVHRTDGEGLPVRARHGIVEPIDVRVTRLLGLALPADAGPVSEIGFVAQARRYGSGEQGGAGVGPGLLSALV